MKKLRAIIADDEEALRGHLKKKLSTLWPELEIAGEARDGEAALRLVNEARPDIAFLDIKMPGLSGIEVARLAPGKCLKVFVTAYDRFAVEAFENEAIDYLLKPVSDERLERTVKRLKERFAASRPPADISAILDGLSRSLQRSSTYLQWIKAQQKEGVRLIPVANIYYFRSTDKYTTVRTKDGEFLIRTTIKELEEELDPGVFLRVHRAAIVNAGTVHTVKRSIAGTAAIRFKDIPDSLTVSRAYAHLFKQM